MAKGIIVTGKLEWKMSCWEEDGPDGYFLNGWRIDNELNLSQFDGKKVKITIEEIEDEGE
jgi:hypothetical protein